MIALKIKKYKLSEKNEEDINNYKTSCIHELEDYYCKNGYLKSLWTHQTPKSTHSLE